MGLVKNIFYRISNPSIELKFQKQSIFPYYHLINDDEVKYIKHLYSFKNRSQLNYDLDILLDAYKPLILDDIQSGVIPENSFMLSFDDGLIENYSTILPLLNERNIKAIFFINPNYINNLDMLYKHKVSLLIDELINTKNQNTLNDIASDLKCSNVNQDIIDNLKKINYTDSYKLNNLLKKVGVDIQNYLKSEQPYLNTNQISEIIDAGHYIGGHTMSHQPLQHLSIDEQEKEIIESIKWIKSNFNIDYSLFSFPFSDKNISKSLIHRLFEYDENILLFGNSGIKKDIDKRIIQRFSLEKPEKDTARLINVENMYKTYNKAIGKYVIKRK